MESRPTGVVRSVEPRRTAQVRLADGQIFEAPVGTPLEEYVALALEHAHEYDIVHRDLGKFGFGLGCGRHYLPFRKGLKRDVIRMPPMPFRDGKNPLAMLAISWVV